MEDLNKYEDAVTELMCTEVYMEYYYGEGETGLNKCIFEEVDLLKEQGDLLYELIDKYKKLEKAFDRACIELDGLDADVAFEYNDTYKDADDWKDYLLEYAEEHIND